MKKSKTFWKSLPIWLLGMAMTGLSAQTVLYEENMGTPSAATLVQNYTGWQNTEVVYLGDGTCDVRTSNASSGYGLASGGGNVMLNDTVKWFQVSGIGTANATNPQLYLGIRKTTAENGRNLRVEVSVDSLSWTLLSLADTLPSGSGTSGWHRIHYDGLPVATRIHLRFSNATTSDCRIDDIAVVDGEEVLLESVAIPHITPSSGLYYEAQTVSMTTATEGAQIYYTLDGSDPTTGSLLYATPFVIEQTLTIKAFAVKANMYDSEISTVHITIQDTNSLVQLPFDISDNSTAGHEDITLMSGFRGYYLGSSYADGSVKFEASNAGRAALVAHLDSSPGALSFDLKGKTGGSAPVSYEGIEFAVMQSADGQSWSLVGIFTDVEIPTADYARFTGMSLSPDTRYVRWQLNTATKGNTQLNNIVITQNEGNSDSTAVLDYMHTPFVCYPNPTNGLLNISDGGLQIVGMTLTDICGQVVRSWSSPVPRSLSLSSLPEGTYLLTIETTEGTIATKFVKY